MSFESSITLYPKIVVVLGVPSTRIPIDGTTFISHILPPVAFYFTSAVLAVTSQTHVVRVALWPLIAVLALRAVLSVDVSRGKPEYSTFDALFVVHVLCGVTRSLSWTLARGPFVRYLRPRNNSPSTIVDALDLASSYRGYGWELSCNSPRPYIPRETRPTNRMMFALYTSISVVAYAFINGVFCRASLMMLRVGSGKVPGGLTLFADSLPLWVRYPRACIISILYAVDTYTHVQTAYDLCTVIGVILFGQDPAQWPPAFDAPWRATSLGDFWGRRWHQLFRQVFLLGGYPLALVLGPSGAVVGAFLVSALLHHILLLVLGYQGGFWRMFVGFGMMAPGILAERAFHRLTGRRVGGVVGWFWTMAWLLTWSTIIFEGFARTPIHRMTLIDDLGSVRTFVERLVTSFDNWLHTI